VAKTPVWSDEEIRVLKENYKTYSNRDEILALLPGRTINGITFRVKQLGLKREFRASQRLSKKSRQAKVKAGTTNLQKYRKRNNNIEGKNNPFYGKHHTEETKQKLSQIRKEYYQKNQHYLKGKLNPIIQKTNLTDNPSQRPGVGAKISKSLRELYNKHPEKHPNSMLTRDHMTNIEKLMEKYLISLELKNGEDFKYNQYIKTQVGFKFPDFLIHNKLVIECDGKYWHQDKRVDEERDQELENVGLTVIHFTGKEIRNRPKYVKEAIRRILDVIN